MLGLLALYHTPWQYALQFAHFVMHVVDFHLCWWPPIFYCHSGALPMRRRFFAWCCSSSHISCSLSAAHMRRVFWLISLGTVPFWGALAPHMRFSVWRISFSTKWSCTVAAFCMAVASMYTSNGGTAASRSSAAHGVLLD